MRVRRPTLKSLTGLRFVAASQVVLLHYGLQNMGDAPQWLRSLVGGGSVGVTLFFVLSGFILTYSYAAADGLATSARRFWYARFARVYPLYLLSLAAVAPLTLRSGSTMSSGVSGARLAEVPWTLAMLQSWVPGLANAINYPAWSLSVEAFFYALFPVIIAVTATWSVRRCIWGIAVLWPAAALGPGLFLVAEAAHLAPLAGASRELWETTVHYFPLLHLPLFITGVLTGRIFLRRVQADDAGWLERHSSALSVSCVGLVCAVLAVSHLIPRLILDFGLIAPVMCLLIVTLASGNGHLSRALGHPAMVLLGEASYAMYLLQDAVWTWASIVESRVGRQIGIRDTYATEWGWFLICATFLLVSSIAAHVCVERPLRRALASGLPRLWTPGRPRGTELAQRASTQATS